MVTSHTIPSGLKVPLNVPHRCCDWLRANRWSTTAQEKRLWPGGSAGSCQQKALQFRAWDANNGPNVRWVTPHSLSSWPRTNRSAHTPRETRHNKTERENSQKGQNRPIGKRGLNNDGVTLNVFVHSLYCSTLCLSPQHFNTPTSCFWGGQSPFLYHFINSFVSIIGL